MHRNRCIGQLHIGQCATIRGSAKVSASLKLPKGDFNACSRVFTNQLADTASDHFHFPDDECGPQQRLIKTWVMGFGPPSLSGYGTPMMGYHPHNPLRGGGLIVWPLSFSRYGPQRLIKIWVIRFEISHQIEKFPTPGTIPPHGGARMFLTPPLWPRTFFEKNCPPLAKNFGVSIFKFRRFFGKCPTSTGF